MHVYTLVIAPGPRRRAVARARTLLRAAVPRSCDYWRTGGWFLDRLGKVERPEIDAWHDAQRARRERFNAEQPAGRTAEEREIDDLFFEIREGPHYEELRRLSNKATIDRTRLTRDLQSPLPELWIPAALVTPDGRWTERPVDHKQGHALWADWLNATVDGYRGGHCIVVADCHC